MPDATRSPVVSAPMKCPVCDVTLSISSREGVEIDFCPQCRGVWLDRGELDKIIERSDDDRQRFASAVGELRTSAQVTNYEPAALIGRQVVGAVNLGVRRIAGFESQFLVLGGVAAPGEQLRAQEKTGSSRGADDPNEGLGIGRLPPRLGQCDGLCLGAGKDVVAMKNDGVRRTDPRPVQPTRKPWPSTCSRSPGGSKDKDRRRELAGTTPRLGGQFL